MNDCYKMNIYWLRKMVLCFKENGKNIVSECMILNHCFMF